MIIELPRTVVEAIANRLDMDRLLGACNLEVYTVYGKVTLIGVDDNKYLKEIPSIKKVWKWNSEHQLKGDEAL